MLYLRRLEIFRYWREVLFQWEERLNFLFQWENCYKWCRKCFRSPLWPTLFFSFDLGRVFELVDVRVDNQIKEGWEIQAQPHYVTMKSLHLAGRYMGVYQPYIYQIIARDTYRCTSCRVMVQTHKICWWISSWRIVFIFYREQESHRRDAWWINRRQLTDRSPYLNLYKHDLTQQAQRSMFVNKDPLLFKLTYWSVLSQSPC